jgi:hypothetical protein
MAFTVTNRMISNEGGLTVETGQFDSGAGGGADFVVTKLRRIINIKLRGIEDADTECIISRNSQTASDVEDDGGSFFLSADLAADKDYAYEARGL